MPASYRNAELMVGGQVSATNTAAVLTVPKGANLVVLQAKTNPVLAALNNSTPSTGAGFVLATANQPQEFPVKFKRNIRFIRASGSDGVLVYQFYRTRPY